VSWTGRQPSLTIAWPARTFGTVRADRAPGLLEGATEVRIAVVGGGPGGLYFAALAKQLSPTHEITVWERNASDDTFGFGVVFSDETLGESSTPTRRSTLPWNASSPAGTTSMCTTATG